MKPKWQKLQRGSRCKMRYHNITKDDMLNGDGLRVVLWVSGCNHYCKDCHNPITWDVQSGVVFDEQAKEEIFTELRKSYVSGVTLSGGDPLHPENRQDIGNLIEEISQKFPTKTIWLYTGFQWDEIKDLPFIKFVDVVVDGEFLVEKKDVKAHWKGSTNQNVILVQKTLQNEVLVLHNS